MSSCWQRISLYTSPARHFSIITALLHHCNRFLHVVRASILYFSGKMVLLKVSGESKAEVLTVMLRSAKALTVLGEIEDKFIRELLDKKPGS